MHSGTVCQNHERAEERLISYSSLALKSCFVEEPTDSERASHGERLPQKCLQITSGRASVVENVTVHCRCHHSLAQDSGPYRDGESEAGTGMHTLHS